jgi:uncharacterized radical SAM protein YgiQ
MQAETSLFSYPKYWAECYGTAPFLPMSRKEMDQLGWDSCDVIIVCGDAYVDHPSFGMAVIGRLLESQGYRVGIIAQPDWTSKDAFQTLGKPNLFFAVSAGNMDSMINRYTADLKIRHDDAYTPNNEGGKRPDRAVTVYSQRCREAYKDVPIIIGGIEASLRRIAQYDYWSDKVRRSVLLDSKADLLLYGNAERAITEVAFRIARGEHPKEMTNIRGTACVVKELPQNWKLKDVSRVDSFFNFDEHNHPFKQNPYTNFESGNTDQSASQDDDPLNATQSCAQNNARLPQSAETPDTDTQVIRFLPLADAKTKQDDTFLLLPSFEKVSNDPVLYAHTSRILHLETNPANAHVIVQPHDQRYVWVNPPPIPLSTEELDSVFEHAYQRVPHPAYGDAKIPAYEMIRFSVNIMRGCFGGCSFCSITEHEGRVIQSRSEDSIINEIAKIRDMTPGFTGTISDLGGPTANMYQLNCKSEQIHENCRRLSCVYPSICKNLVTDHSPTTKLYRRARTLPGIKRILIASGLRYDLAVEDPEYIQELVTHHVGGYLKIAPEHTESGPLSKMMKPGMGTYHRFKELFDKYSKEAGKQQYLIPYFIAAHPGTQDIDMLNLALWLKENGFRADQVQNFYPSPMASATAMYYSERDPLHRVNYKTEKVSIPKGIRQRKLHKAFLRYHDPENWPLLREALKSMGKTHLIGYGKKHLIPPTQPKQESRNPGLNKRGKSPVKAVKKGNFQTQHTGLPPRKKS